MSLQGMLPGGMSVNLHDAVADRARCGVLALDEVQVNSDEGAALATAEVAAVLRKRFEGRAPSAIAPLAAARTLYKSFGMDPSRHRPSSEALLRRVLKGQDLYHINSAVDACNLASLEFLLPVGMYDRDRIQGDVTVRVGEPGDSYAGIRKGPVHVGGRLALYDAEGPFGSPTSDSARTCVEPGATRLLAVIFAPASRDTQVMDAAMDVFASRFGEFCGATCTARFQLGGGE